MPFKIYLEKKIKLLKYEIESLMSIQLEILSH